MALLENEKALIEALRPFADFADPRRTIPARFAVTQGSGLAKRQLTMGDCYAARDAIDVVEAESLARERRYEELHRG